MSAPRTSQHLAVYLRVLDQPASREVVAGAIAGFFAANGVVPGRVTSSSPAGARSRALPLARLPDVVAHPEYNAVTIWRKDPCETTDITVYLAPFDPANQRRQRRPMCVIWTSARQVMGDDVRTFLCDMVSTYPVAHGFVGSFRSRAFAGREVFQSMDSVSEIDASTDARLHEDAMLDYLTNDRLRRLYPVTLIGPAIWAQLPPMPACDPAPTVEDLGDCKLLTVWPTLCEPRDPAFLRGTRALREWLWPFTIQNPADHVDNDPVG